MLCGPALVSHPDRRVFMSTLPKIVPKLPPKFMHFDLGKYAPYVDQLVRHRATPVLLTSHVICPCIVPPKQGGTGIAVSDCPECNGTGFCYVGNGVETLASIIGVNANDTRSETSRTEIGQIRAIFPSDVTIASGDRIQLYKSIVPIRHSRKYNKALGGMRLPFDVRDAKNVVTKNPRTLKLIELERGPDYTLDVDKNLIAFGGDKVYDNAVISAVFMIAPYYIITDLPSSFRGQLSSAFSEDGSEEWVKLPQSCTAERSDAWAHGFLHKEVTQSGDLDEGVGY